MIWDMATLLWPLWLELWDEPTLLTSDRFEFCERRDIFWGADYDRAAGGPCFTAACSRRDYSTSCSAESFLDSLSSLSDNSSLEKSCELCWRGSSISSDCTWLPIFCLLLLSLFSEGFALLDKLCRSFTWLLVSTFCNIAWLDWPEMFFYFLCLSRRLSWCES